MKRLLIVVICGILIPLAIWSYKLSRDYHTQPEFKAIAPGETIEGTIDPGMPDVTGRKGGLVKFSSKSGMFKSDKDRREWLERWATDKQTKDVVFSSDPSTILSRSVEEAFGTHRIIPTIGGAEDEALFYPSTPVEYASLSTLPYFPEGHWRGWDRIIINNCDCYCVCCDCRPCGEEPVIPPTTYEPPSRPPIKPPITPPAIPPVEPPITPPDPPPPKVPEGSTLWMLMLGIVAVGIGRRI